MRNYIADMGFLSRQNNGSSETREVLDVRLKALGGGVHWQNDYDKRRRSFSFAKCSKRTVFRDLATTLYLLDYTNWARECSWLNLKTIVVPYISQKVKFLTFYSLSLLLIF